MKKFRVTLTFEFVRTNIRSNELNPTNEEMDEFMNSNAPNSEFKHYYQFLIDNYLYGTYYETIPEEIVYKNGGILEFVVDEIPASIYNGKVLDALYQTPEEIKNDALEFSLEDGSYEGGVLVFPTRKTKNKINPSELGVFDFRKSENINVIQI